MERLPSGCEGLQGMTQCCYLNVCRGKEKYMVLNGDKNYDIDASHIIMQYNFEMVQSFVYLGSLGH
jgi:hypothetical protein